MCIWVSLTVTSLYILRELEVRVKYFSLKPVEKRPSPGMFLPSLNFILPCLEASTLLAKEQNEILYSIVVILELYFFSYQSWSSFFIYIYYVQWIWKLTIKQKCKIPRYVIIASMARCFLIIRRESVPNEWRMGKTRSIWCRGRSDKMQSHTSFTQENTHTRFKKTEYDVQSLW